MSPHLPAAGAAVLLLCAAGRLLAQSVDELIPQNVNVERVQYQSRTAVRLLAKAEAVNGSSYAVVKGSRFRDGTIAVTLAGKPAAGAGPAARGFIGIAFRMNGDKYEFIYLRPTNGRADDQVRRNHSTQYGSHPDFDFARLRKESPEKYESYADLETGAWTKCRIEVQGRAAKLFVNDSAQPVLVVNDLKLEPQEGAVALWIEPGTEGYFRDLKIMPRTSGSATAASKIYFDRAHGELPAPAQMAAIGSRLHYSLADGASAITPEALQGSRLLYLRAPNQAFTSSEKQTIVSFVQSGGSLLLVLDEEQRQKLAVVGANDFLTPFGMRLTGDTPRIPNTGAVAKAGEINRADREIPYDGGRAVLGGTPFAYQLDEKGQSAQPSAAYTKLANGGRVVVMGEGMPSLFLGSGDGTRLTADKAHPQWWGKDSGIFMEEVMGWLLAR